jgi:hypothetical protein
MASWDGREVVVPPAEKDEWSPIRRFTVRPDTATWDRSVLREPKFRPHPKMVFSPLSLKGEGVGVRGLLAQIKASPELKTIFTNDVLKPARQLAGSPLWKDWPASDRGDEIKGYYSVGRQLIRAAFAYKLTGLPEFANAPDIFARIATYPPGGRSSPEGMGGDEVEDSTSLTEFLALAYDWFYDKYSPEQRAAFEKSLDWRIDKWMHEFRWGGSLYTPFERGGYSGPSVSPACIQMTGNDHNWEGSLATLPAAIAIYDKSAAAREYFHLMSNYLIGVTERIAQTGCPDQGLSYGYSHQKWLMYQTCYLQSALPELRIARNPFYRDAARFFTAVTPGGMPAAPWGRGDAYGYYWAHRAEAFGLLATVANDPDAWRSWRAQVTKRSCFWRPWVHLTANSELEIRNSELEKTGVRPSDSEFRIPHSELNFVFPAAGWVATHSMPPGEPRAFDGTGVVFVCRPAHRHNVFFNNNALQFYAYGQNLNCGGGGAEDPLPFHTMSHNTVLVDGLGQAFGGPDAYSRPARGGLLAWKVGRDYVYWAGDATQWYPHTPFPVSTWKVVFDDRVYGKLAAPNLRMFRRHVLFVRKRYVVVLDDLATDPDRPSRFTWLWHVLQKGPADYDAKTGRLTYSAGNVKVLLTHVANADKLEFSDRAGLAGWLTNPLTGEDFSTQKWTKREVVDNPAASAIIPAHNFWFTAARPASAFQFLAVIFPVKPGAAEPRITRLDDLTVKVESGGDTDVISFDARTKHPATIRVDLDAFRQPAWWEKSIN